ncbi:MAG TPA: MEDS domain-containing protein [Candidatus Saccharimonadia bacterium]
MQNILHEIPRPNKRFLQTIQNVEVHDHVCLLYRDSQEGLASAAAFIEAGLRKHDQCIYISDDNTPEAVLQALEHAGITTENMLETEQLVLGTKDGSYLENGSFSPDTTIKVFAEASHQATSKGFRAVRGCAEMTWQLADDSHTETEHLLEYEARINDELFPKHQVVGMCQFNMNRFGAAAIREIIYTHPVVIIGGLMCENIYYKPPGMHRVNSGNDLAELEVKKMVNDVYRFAERRYGF